MQPIMRTARWKIFLAGTSDQDGHALAHAKSLLIKCWMVNRLSEYRKYDDSPPERPRSQLPRDGRSFSRTTDPRGLGRYF
jgi:hypothetical protein